MTARVQMKNILLYKHDNDLIIATKMRFGWGDGVRHETSFSNDPPTKHEEHGCLCPVWGQGGGKVRICGHKYLSYTWPHCCRCVFTTLFSTEDLKKTGQVWCANPNLNSQCVSRSLNVGILQHTTCRNQNLASVLYFAKSYVQKLIFYFRQKIMIVLQLTEVIGTSFSAIRVISKMQISRTGN